MRTISLQQMQPEIKGVSEFNNINRPYRQEYNKRSYTHRLMCIAGGNCSFYYGDKRRFNCEKGDIIYFPPNEYYGNEFSEGNFRVYNIYFDFYPYREDSDIYSTVCTEKQPLPEFMGETVHFSDCELLNSLQRFIAFPDALERFSDIYREYSERRLCYKQKASALLTDLLISLHRFHEDRMGENVTTVGEILAYINQNCRLPLRGQMLSEKFNYHPSYINRLVQRATSMSLYAYILDTKIRQAAIMLRETDMSVTEIALWFSFYDSSHFSAVFRKIIGCKPHEYRSRNRNVAPNSIITDNSSDKEQKTMYHE